MATKFTVYRGFPSTPNHVWSPFVNKLETRFRLANISYRIDVGSPRNAPRGKIPYLSTTEDSTDHVLGDTTLITRQLVADGTLHDLNAGLTPAQQAQDLAMRALLEDKLYFYLQRERWADNYYAMRDGVLAALPFPVRVLVGNLAYRAVAASLHGQGTGRYSADEVRVLKQEVWEGLAAMLSESRVAATGAAVAGREDGSCGAPFWILGRADPTEADATVYGFLAASLVCTAYVFPPNAVSFQVSLLSLRISVVCFPLPEQPKLEAHV